MFSLALTLVVFGVALAVFLTAGSVFLQGYFYTEPSENLFWQAPTMAAVVTLFVALWCWLDASTPGASATSIPYDVFYRFSHAAYLAEKPVPKLWSVRRGDPDPVEYRREAYTEIGQTRYRYVRNSAGREFWTPARVEAVLIEVDGQKKRFEPQKVGENDNPRFASEDGWVMYAYTDRGITGQPFQYRLGLFAANVFLNLFHFAVWFVGLWLIVRFHVPHALLLSSILWLTMTLTILPWLLLRAASEAPPVATPGVALVRPVPARASTRQCRFPLTTGSSHASLA